MYKKNWNDTIVLSLDTHLFVMLAFTFRFEKWLGLSWREPQWPNNKIWWYANDLLSDGKGQEAFMNMLKDLWATELALQNNKKSFLNHEWLLIGNSVKVYVQFFSLDFGNHPVITSYIIVYTCGFCLKNLSLSDVFIGVSDKLQTDHMTCWVM